MNGKAKLLTPDRKSSKTATKKEDSKNRITNVRATRKVNAGITPTSNRKPLYTRKR